MISFDEAIELIRSVAQPLGTETVAARRGRRPGPCPPRHRADRFSAFATCRRWTAMPFARRTSTSFPASLQLVGEIPSPAAAGTARSSPAPASRIFTGAPVPDRRRSRGDPGECPHASGNAAIIDEHPGRRATHPQARFGFCGGRRTARRRPPARPARDRCRSGRRSRGAGSLSPAARCTSSAPATSSPSLERHANEPTPFPKASRFGVAALAAQWGAECIGRTRLRDDLPAMQRAAEAALEQADVVVVTGGASVGEKDFAKTMFEPLGLELVFSKVSIKPGKPVWLGRVGEKLVVGLPGNPTSALVTARLLLAPLLARPERPSRSRARSAGEPCRSPRRSRRCGARETFHRARIRRTAQPKSSRSRIRARRRRWPKPTCSSASAQTRPALDAGEPVEVLDF